MNINIFPAVYAISGAYVSGPANPWLPSPTAAFDRPNPPSGAPLPCLYIGASIYPQLRFDKQHVPALDQNRHYNESLQNAWNQYGAASFVLLILETVSNAAMLPEREKDWLLRFKEKEILFNRTLSGTPGMRGKKHSEEAKAKMSRAKRGKQPPDNRKEYCFRSPSGEVLQVKGLRELCAAHNLNISHMSKVARGLLKQHKGWTSPAPAVSGNETSLRIAGMENEKETPVRPDAEF
ncbi:MAG: hypothetical protein QOE70_5967 [Chthoniobacter sp.]|jgi:group I intron endonuclease|nr:hypothetical protein [Chthoniobacter sp.]